MSESQPSHPMKDVIIAAMILIAVWIYLDNLKKDATISTLRSQAADQGTETNRKIAEATANLNRQLAEAKTGIQIANRQIADLRAKLPNSAWLQDRVDQARGVLEAPAAPVPFRK